MRFERLGNIVSIAKGKKPTFSESPDENSVRVLQIDDLRNDNNIKYTDDKTGVFAKKEDVLLAWDGANAGTIGFGKTGYIGSTIAVLRKNNPKDFDTVFIGKFLQSQSEFLRGKSTGATIPHIDRKSLESLRIPRLSLSDQLHIANILSKAENLISQRKQSIALLDEFLKSTFLEMFGDNSKNQKAWERITLIEACANKHDVKCGPFGTQLGKSEYQIYGVPVWGIPQINSQFKILPKDFVTDTKALELDEYSVIPFDIVMSRKGNVGKCSLFPKDFPKGIIHSDVLRIRTDKKKMLPEFLLFQLKFSKHVEIQINGVSKGAIMAGINVGKLKHIIIQLPPIELQTQFAQIVEKTEALKAQYQSSLQELDNLYGCLSQRAFRGELTLNHAEEQVLMAAEPEGKYK
ncbi:MAG: restriction endonuclease subunit S [Ignavibacteria bacterium]|nr:restriction endonuclease subunit S [Ignavibacteria bacterium]